MTVKLRPSGWEISGKKIPWTWGQINYWDIERSSWRDVLRAYKHADHQVLSTTILPSIHQVGPGQYDFTSINPNLELAAFLQEVKNCGLKLICWVGPRQVPGCGAAGYPEELLSDDDVLARDNQNQAVFSNLGYGQELFTLPSLLHEKLSSNLMTFKEALKPILEPFIHPDGPIVGLGLTQAPGWDHALDTYAADYHGEIIKMFQKFLKKRYGRISNLNQTHYGSYEHFKEIEAPKKWSGTEQRVDQLSVDWLNFKEDYFIKAAEQLYSIFSDLKFDSIPMFLAALPTMALPNNLHELEKTRCFDYIMPDIRLESNTDFDSWSTTVLQTRYHTLFNQVMESDELKAEQQQYLLLKSVAAGVRGWDCLNPVGSGQFSGFLTDRKGHPSHYHHRFWQIMQEHQSSEGFLESQKHADLVVFTDSQIERTLACTASDRLDDGNLNTVALDEKSGQYLIIKNNIIGFLKKHQFSFLISDGETSVNRLNKNQLIILPSNSELTESLQTQVNQLVKNGHDVLVIGTLPDSPEEGPYTGLKELAANKTKKVSSKKKKTSKIGKLHHLDEFNDGKMNRLFKQIGIGRAIRIDHDLVELAYHKLRNRLFITVHNPSEENIKTMVRRDGKFVLKDFWLNNKFLGGNNEIQVILPAKSITLWELILC